MLVIVPETTASCSMRIAALLPLSRAAEIVPEFVMSISNWQRTKVPSCSRQPRASPPVVPGSPLKLIASESESSTSVLKIPPVLFSVKRAMPSSSPTVPEDGSVPNKESTPIVGPPPELIIVPLFTSVLTSPSASRS